MLTLMPQTKEAKRANNTALRSQLCNLSINDAKFIDGFVQIVVESESWLARPSLHNLNHSKDNRPAYPRADVFEQSLITSESIDRSV
jgi:hypothetical protein